LVPTIVTGKTAVPRKPDAGLIELMVGAPVANTVKDKALLTKLPTETVTLLTPRAAPAVMVRVVLIWVPAGFTVNGPAETPLPLKFTAVAPFKLVPVMITGTAP
jgi:hypothetical protein